MRLHFTKMQGLGNDFVVIDAISQSVDLSTATVTKLADRHFGVGCDQVLLIESPRSDDTDFHYRIFNADGSEVEACGNGARCFARYVTEKGLSSKSEIPVGTVAGKITLRLAANGRVEVDMGIPVFDPASIPFVAEQQADSYPLEVDGQQRLFSVLSMGNPHAVMVVPSVDRAEVARLGPIIENHPRFPQRTNAGFMQIIGPSEIRLRVYERGAGETLACGSGACAAVVAGRRLGLLGEEVIAHLLGGDLMVKWRSEGQSVLIEGPAETVYEGTIDL
ncbi:MAG: diaminopimelate epimerase [Candidatus Thiodiazotropha sp.]|nr:diaminopimelate epimerase [Candidatus Thiodiazotropha sp. (ex Lucina pensylvanica)]MBT3062122.1 diaminopimelate epimerase [Candidatus Thiodiazotropha sp. (ex Lucina pensylvanica)]MBV2093636.1 diaminopimelate epimerase [Candidatus Thiodiazotropha sp. (ex Codakia orbicularis)]PUB72516.1 MAG: diaminopimelate epimerase [gamma proteobacterium symbiont of Ctena orbiculata]PUB76443.1 MAG: diaminopimelate epimerase [gamma proteobacterium symbiont of Ctena orbiculata]